LGFLKGSGIIVAIDTSDLELIKRVIKVTSAVESVTGYKVGLEAALAYGLKEIVGLIRSLADKPIIYDHQKAMGDTPHIGEGFARILRRSGVDAAIGFPHAGPKTMVAWVEALRREGIVPIIGGEMTHEGYLRSEGGYICDEAPELIYLAASEMGIRHYVLPGNKVDRALRYAETIARKVRDPVFLLPGARVYEDWDRISREMIPLYRNVHLIVGRAILREDISVNDIKKMAERLGV